MDFSFLLRLPAQPCYGVKRYVNGISSKDRSWWDSVVVNGTECVIWNPVRLILLGRGDGKTRSSGRPLVSQCAFDLSSYVNELHLN